MNEQERLRGFAIEYTKLRERYGIEISGQAGLTYEEMSSKTGGPRLEVKPTLAMNYQLIQGWQEPPPPEPPFGLTTEQILALEPFIEQARTVAEVKGEVKEDESVVPDARVKATNGRHKE